MKLSYPRRYAGRLRSRKGFSLVELLVAMVVGLILLGGIYQIFLSSTTTARAGEQLGLLQENGRFALDYMARDIRMAGYRGCSISAPLTNILNDAATRAYNFEEAIEGFNNVTGTPSTYLTGVNHVAGTDVLILRTPVGNEVPVVTISDLNNVFVAADNPFASGDILMISDCSKARIFQAGDITVAGEVSHPSSGTPGNNSGMPDPSQWGPVVFDVGSEVIQFATWTYFIRTSTSGAGRSLFLKEGDADSQELVEGVDSMQILYGEDTNADDAVDGYVNAAAVTDWDDVLTVRIGLLLNSIAENAQQDFDTDTYDVDGDGVDDFGPANDRRLRQVFTATVGLRNRLP